MTKPKFSENLVFVFFKGNSLTLKHARTQTYLSPVKDILCSPAGLTRRIAEYIDKG